MIRSPVVRGMLVGAAAWFTVAVATALPLGRALCSGQANSGPFGYFGCQHGAGRLWQASFFAGIAFLVTATSTLMWSTRTYGRTEATEVAQRLVAPGLLVGAIPAAAALLFALLSGGTWMNTTLVVVALGWAAVTLATAVGLRGRGIIARVAALTGLNLGLWITDLLFSPLRIVEWLMVIAFTFPAAAIALLVRDRHGAVQRPEAIPAGHQRPNRS